MSAQRDQWDELDRFDQLDPSDATMDIPRLMEDANGRSRATSWFEANASAERTGNPYDNESDSRDARPSTPMAVLPAADASTDLADDPPASEVKPAGPPQAGSLPALRRRLEQLPWGHPSSPYHDEGERKPAPPRLKHLELAPPAPERTGPEPVKLPWANAADADDDGAPDVTIDGNADQAKLTRDQVRLAEEAQDKFREAAGHSLFGSYLSTGLTARMQGIAGTLEHGTLPPDSLERALLEPDVFKARFAELIRRHPERTAEQLVTRVPGALCYPVVFEPSSYSAGIASMQDALAEAGFQLQARKNAWSSAEHRCVYTMWHDADSGLPFQVQFHTPASLEAQQLARTSATLMSDPRIPATESVHLKADLASAWAAVPAPPGNADIDDYRSDNRSAKEPSPGQEPQESAELRASPAEAAAPQGSPAEPASEEPLTLSLEPEPPADHAAPGDLAAEPTPDPPTPTHAPILSSPALSVLDGSGDQHSRPERDDPFLTDRDRSRLDRADLHRADLHRADVDRSSLDRSSPDRGMQDRGGQDRMPPSPSAPHRMPPPDRMAPDPSAPHRMPPPDRMAPGRRTPDRIGTDRAGTDRYAAPARSEYGFGSEDRGGRGDRERSADSRQYPQPGQARDQYRGEDTRRPAGPAPHYEPARYDDYDPLTGPYPRDGLDRPDRRDPGRDAGGHYPAEYPYRRDDRDRPSSDLPSSSARSNRWPAPVDRPDRERNSGPDQSDVWSPRQDRTIQAPHRERQRSEPYEGQDRRDDRYPRDLADRGDGGDWRDSRGRRGDVTRPHRRPANDFYEDHAPDRTVVDLHADAGQVGKYPDDGPYPDEDRYPHRSDEQDWPDNSGRRRRTANPDSYPDPSLQAASRPSGRNTP